MAILYDDDFPAWSQEQAGLLRAGRCEHLDRANLARHVAELGAGWHGEVRNRLSLLMEQLIWWDSRPEDHCDSWRIVLRAQRDALGAMLRQAPSLSAALHDPYTLEIAWLDAVARVAWELGRELPGACPWSTARLLAHGFPDSADLEDG